MVSQLDELNYTISNSSYNLSSGVVDFIVTPSANYTANISSKLNDSIILSESFFFIEYSIFAPAVTNTVLINNWFLSMLQSINININSYNFQLNSISNSRTFTMLVNTLRYLDYDMGDFNKYNKIQHEHFQQNQMVGADVTIQNNVVDAFRPTIYSLNNVYTGYLKLKLTDILPAISEINQMTGLLNFSFSLNYNAIDHSLSGAGVGARTPQSFKITKFMYHFPIKTYNSQQIIDIDLNFIKTIGILNGRSSEEKIFDVLQANFQRVGQFKTEVVVSNIQLSTNKIYKIIIYPVFSYPNLANTPFPVGAAANNHMNIYNSDGSFLDTTVLDKFKNLPTENFDSKSATGNLYKRSIDYLLTPTGSCGSQLFGITDLKVVINGNQIAPSNINNSYVSAGTADYINYYFGFNQSGLNEVQKQNLFLNYDLYKLFSPLIVDISEQTALNAYNSLTFSYSAYNRFTIPNNFPLTLAGGIKLETFYSILNLQVINN